MHHIYKGSCIVRTEAVDHSNLFFTREDLFNQGGQLGQIEGAID